MSNNKSIFRSSATGKNYLIPFLIVVSCFALWGFACAVTNPMVKAFSTIFRTTAFDGILVQVAYYAGYFAMALPAALFIQKYSFKAGIIIGLSLYAIGAFMFLPATAIGNFYSFLPAYFILTCGLSFLETSANPYILTMGDKDSATMRLNFAQSFNPIGNLAGMFVAIHFIQSKLSPLSTAERKELDDAAFEAVKNSDLEILSGPYVAIGIVIIAILIIMFLVRMPKGENENQEGKIEKIIPTFKKLFAVKQYREGVIAEFFYVGAQVMCWTFIIQLGTKIFMGEGMTEQESDIRAEIFNIAAMVLFCLGRFICTYLIKFFEVKKMLAFLSVVAFILLGVVILAEGRICIYALVLVSGCMSLMFPTIYSLALEPVNQQYIKLGAAGLIMSIIGGSVLPPLQAILIDIFNPNISFVIPLICFVVIFGFAMRKTN